MADYRLGLLHGDGIGPEIVPGAAEVMTAAATRAGCGIEWSALPMGASALEEYGDPVPDVTKDALAGLDAWLMGPHDAASYPDSWKRRAGSRPPAGELRNQFALFANVRPSRTYPGVPSVARQADLVIVRENTEGFLADRNMHQGVGEFTPVPGVGLCVGVFTQKAIERVIRYGFKLAASRHSRIAVAHKAGPLPATLGLYKRIVHEVAEDFPGVAASDIHIDTLVASLVRRPEEFDVVVAENLLGDILSDLASEVVGTPGLASSINLSETHAMASAAHGSAPDIAGQGIANPLGVVLAGALLFGWLGETKSDPRAFEAQRIIDSAVTETLAQEVLTPDMGGSASTSQVIEHVKHLVSQAT